MNNTQFLKELSQELEACSYILWGAGDSGKIFMNYIDKHNLPRPIYFCDTDSNKWGTSINGILVQGIEVFKNAQERVKIVLSVDNVNSMTIRSQIKTFNLGENIQVLEESRNTFFRQYIYDEAKGWNDKLVEEREEFSKLVTENKEKIAKIYYALEDDISKDTYEKLIKGRSYGRREMLADIFDHNQYFLNLLDIDNREVFIDCGAFKGDTIAQFLEVCNNEYSKIIGFEPNEYNFEKLLKNFNGIRNIKTVNNGIFDKKCTLSFLLNGSASMITEDETNKLIKIETTTLDDELVEEKPSFIKMDIEGAELEALKGAEKTLIKYRPKLAICVYHKPEDLWEIPMYILNLNLSYKIYMSIIAHQERKLFYTQWQSKAIFRETDMKFVIRKVKI